MSYIPQWSPYMFTCLDIGHHTCLLAWTLDAKAKAGLLSF
uniref:Uncharacterized protein n=1 Tax=Arundo donax TaxID=35708 RepID=A0A0A8Y164_ARUDO